jgi:hypothetical protein
VQCLSRGILLLSYDARFDNKQNGAPRTTIYRVDQEYGPLSIQRTFHPASLISGVSGVGSGAK